MSAATVLNELHQAPVEMPDPGASGVITVARSPCVVNLVSVASESRTLARPTRPGVLLAIHHQTDGGDITLTVTGGFNEDGDTTFTFSDPGQVAWFQSFMTNAGVFFWRKFADYSSANLTPTEAAWLDGVTPGTGVASKVLVLDSSGNLAMPAAPAAIDERNYEVVITTNVILGAENGRTYFLNLANGFTSTLPAPALGLHFRFVVAIAPTTAYIIVTNAAANVLYGMTEERAGTAGVAGAAKNTFNFVANQAKIGDWVEFYSDGTNWYYHGMTDIAAGNTVA